MIRKLIRLFKVKFLGYVSTKVTITETELSHRVPTSDPDKVRYV